MSKKSKSLAVCVELLPRKPVPPIQNAEAMLEEIVQRKVAEALASESSILQPFMQTKHVSDAIRKHQNVIHTLKFKYYFEDWGCLICGTKDAMHASLGMCRRCHGRVVSRMLTSLKKAADERPTFEEPKDLEAIAREALMPAVAALKPRVRKPR